MSYSKLELLCFMAAVLNIEETITNRKIEKEMNWGKTSRQDEEKGSKKDIFRTLTIKNRPLSIHTKQGQGKKQGEINWVNWC